MRRSGVAAAGVWAAAVVVLVVVAAVAAVAMAAGIGVVFGAVGMFVGRGHNQKRKDVCDDW